MIGNPPWDRIKLQEVEWFATRSPALAQAPTAAARAEKRHRAATQTGQPLAAAFDAAKARADTLGKLVRGSGHYPLLGGGDINLYSLFVERAMLLIKPDGLVGLLTPSGIYADKTAARFFQTVSTNGRVSGLFDFENRRLGKTYPSSPTWTGAFKFVALIFGGEARRFDRTDCAFFLPDTATIEDDPERCFPLAPDGLHPRQPQHRHRARLPHPPRCRHHPSHLRPPSRPRRPLRQPRAQDVARPLPHHVPHDQRLTPLPHRGPA